MTYCDIVGEIIQFNAALNSQVMISFLFVQQNSCIYSIWIILPSWMLVLFFGGSIICCLYSVAYGVSLHGFSLASNHSADSQTKGKGMHWALVLLICVVVSIFVVLGAVTAYKYWQKRKKQQDQARFLKLFEDGDDIEDDLGIGPLSHVI